MQNNDPYHYQVIRRAIAALDAAGPAPLALSDLAAQIGLSSAHFQRVFSAWVGVSPKRYQQYLALAQAKTLLRARFSTLDTAQTLGLSGGGRLHDLFIRWEAMSPGSYAAQAAQLPIRWGWFDSPFGPALVMGTARGICGIAFAAEIGADAAMADLRQRWPQAQFIHDPAALADWVGAAFGNGGGDLPLHMIGAPFQIKVWEALLRIPSGNVTSYGQIATAIGHAGAMRAVGTAVGRNPVAALIPCHRVLRQSGALGGYHWGLPVKRALLAWEAARRDCADDKSAIG